VLLVLVLVLVPVPVMALKLWTPILTAQRPRVQW